MNCNCRILRSLAPNKGLNIIYHGNPYPSLPSADPISQSFNLTLHCATELSPIDFQSYDGISLNLEWSTPAGCEFKGTDDTPQDDDTGGGDSDSGDGEKEPESVGSGVGWFLLVLLLAFLGYFALGAYYNYTTYGATGMDLIP